MKTLIEILKGVIIGIANIMPGLSGGTLAIAMGIYEKLIYVVNNIFKQPLKCIKLIWPYVVGMAIGVGSSIIGISYLFNTAPVPASMLFVGLIIGSLPTVREELGTDKITVRDYIVFTIMAALIIFMPLITSNNIVEITSSVKDLITLCGLGIIAAATMVIPGISGSMMLMALGYYTNLVTIVSETVKAVIMFDFNKILSNSVILFPFGIGMIIGIFLTAKMIEILIKKYHTAVYWGIIGLIIASPFPIILKLDMYNISLLQIAISIILFIIGIFATKLLSGKDEGGKINEENI